MYNISADRYFNTWSSNSPAIMMFLPAGFEIVAGAYSFASGEYSEFPFSDKIKLYEHDFAGRYLRLTMEHAGTTLQLQYWKTDNWTVRGRLEVVHSGEWGLRFMPTLAFGFQDQEKPGEAKDGFADSGTVKKVSTNIDSKGVKRQEEGYELKYRSYYFGIAFADTPVRHCLAKNSSYMGEEMVKHGYYAPFTDSAEANYLNSTFNLEETPVIDFSVAVTNHPLTAADKAKEALELDEEDLSEIKECLQEALGMEGRFSSCAEALRDVMAWNAIADQHNGIVFTSLTRFWIDKKFGGWFRWLDDVFYHALIATWSGDWQMGENNLKAAMDNVVPGGNLACLMSAFTEWVDRSQPPVFAFIVWKYYELTHDRNMLMRVFDTLYEAHKWWFRKRDGNKNGVLEYGSSMNCGDGHYKQTKLACKDEAAMDNSPMYDTAKYVPEAETLDMEDITLNSLLVLDAESLAKMARVLGEDKIAAELSDSLQLHKEKINQVLWDEERGIYANRLWSGEFASPSPTSFYPLAAGIPDKERADILIKHIFNEDEFWTKAPLPSIWAKDEAVHDNVYWRGRMWPPLNFFAYIGLKRYGYAREANLLAEKSAEVFTNAFENERACYENYDTFTGLGKSVDSDPFYGWGALLPLMWVFNFVDSSELGGLNFGAFNQENMIINSLKTHFGKVDLKLGTNTEVRIDGEPVFVSDAKGPFEDFRITDNYAAVFIPGQEQEAKIEFPQIVPLLAYINGTEVESASEFVLTPGKNHYVEIWF